MSSKLTSICDSNHSDSLPSVLHGPGVFDNLRELSEESLAPTEIYDINKTYNGFKSVRVIDPPCINCQKKGVPCVESDTTRSTRCQFSNLGKRNCSQANHRLPDNPRRLWSRIKRGGRFGLEAPVDEPPTSDATSDHSNQWEVFNNGIITEVPGPKLENPFPQGNPIGVAPEVPILVTRKDGRPGKLKRNLVVQDEIDTDAEGSDELEITTPIQKRRIKSTSLSQVQASTTIHEVIRCPQPCHPHLPLPPPIFNHPWPALLETQCLQNLNQSLTTIDSGI
ncbi:hypothetical protein O181_054486 [Austropuccinia psidii MF-1]|uniref:Uncharacterized protein n=1 Tax=Austropuccinia psidii MF-1 TaxID=1389203 RepID=A0A9Q3E2M5_9BASI|nr:hypothetical protein [Austropuccinia psidii MF-1]